jgi:hypothetical protein
MWVFFVRSSIVDPNNVFTGIERKVSSFRAGMDSSDGEAVHLF